MVEVAEGVAGWVGDGVGDVRSGDSHRFELACGEEGGFVAVEKSAGGGEGVEAAGVAIAHEAAGDVVEADGCRRNDEIHAERAAGVPEGDTASVGEDFGSGGGAGWIGVGDDIECWSVSWGHASGQRDVGGNGVEDLAVGVGVGFDGD